MSSPTVSLHEWFPALNGQQCISIHPDKFETSQGDLGWCFEHGDGSHVTAINRYLPGVKAGYAPSATGKHEIDKNELHKISKRFGFSRQDLERSFPLPIRKYLFLERCLVAFQKLQDPELIANMGEHQLLLTIKNHLKPLQTLIWNDKLLAQQLISACKAEKRPEVLPEHLRPPRIPIIEQLEEEKATKKRQEEERKKQKQADKKRQKSLSVETQGISDPIVAYSCEAGETLCEASPQDSSEAEVLITETISEPEFLETIETPIEESLVPQVITKEFLADLADPEIPGNLQILTPPIDFIQGNPRPTRQFNLTKVELTRFKDKFLPLIEELKAADPNNIVRGEKFFPAMLVLQQEFNLSTYEALEIHVNKSWPGQSITNSSLKVKQKSGYSYSFCYDLHQDAREFLDPVNRQYWSYAQFDRTVLKLAMQHLIKLEIMENLLETVGLTADYTQQKTISSKYLPTLSRRRLRASSTILEIVQSTAIQPIAVQIAAPILPINPPDLLSVEVEPEQSIESLQPVNLKGQIPMDQTTKPSAKTEASRPKVTSQKVIKCGLYKVLGKINQPAETLEEAQNNELEAEKVLLELLGQLEGI